MKGRLLGVETGLHFSLVCAPILFGCVPIPAALLLAAFFFFLLFLFPEAISSALVFPRLSLVCFSLVWIGILAQIFFFSLNSWDTLHEFLKWSAFAIGVVLIQALPGQSSERLLLTLAWTGGLQAAYGLFQVLWDHDYVLWKAKEFHKGFATGTFFNRNHLAGMLEMSLGVQIGLLLSAMRRRKILRLILLLFLILLSAAALLKTGSRMGLLSFSAAYLVAGILLLFSREKKLLGPWFVLLTTFAVLFLALGKNVYGRLLDAQLFAAEWGGRPAAWRDCLKLIRDFPIFGTGLGTFEWIFPAYQSENLIYGWNHAHQDYLQLAAELGPPLFAIFVLSILGVLTVCRGGSLTLGCLMGLWSLLFHGMSDFNFAIPANAMLWCFVLSIAYKLKRDPDHD